TPPPCPYPPPRPARCAPRCPASPPAPASSSSPTRQQHGCPQEPQGTDESDPRAQGDSDGATARLPAPGCFPTSTITGWRRQRATSPIFTQGGRPSRKHGAV